MTLPQALNYWKRICGDSPLGGERSVALELCQRIRKLLAGDSVGGKERAKDRIENGEGGFVRLGADKAFGEGEKRRNARGFQRGESGGVEGAQGGDNEIRLFLAGSPLAQGHTKEFRKVDDGAHGETQ